MEPPVIAPFSRYRLVERGILSKAMGARIDDVVLEAIGYDKEKELKRACEIYSELEEKYPKIAYLPHNRGIALSENKDPEAAVKALKKAAELDPTNDQYLTDLGFVYLETTPPDIKLAVQTFGKALELEETSMDALTGRGDSYLLLNQCDRAFNDYRKLIELSNGSAPSHFLLGKAYYLCGQYKKAVPELKQAVDLDPEDVVSRTFFGLAVEERFSFKGAKTYFEKVIEKLDSMNIDRLTDHELIAGCLCENRLNENTYEIVYKYLNKATAKDIDLNNPLWFAFEVYDD